MHGSIALFTAAEKSSKTLASLLLVDLTTVSAEADWD